MTNIRAVLAANLKRHRHARGWSQAKLAEKMETSTQYIGMLEIGGKFPSSKMVQKLANTLGIDPTELFFKDIDPDIVIKNAQKMAFKDIGEAFCRFITTYVDEKVRELDEKIREMDESAEK